jgi:hypothetical protein
LYKAAFALAYIHKGGATGGKLLSQSAKLDWLKITTEETKIDFLNN